MGCGEAFDFFNTQNPFMTGLVGKPRSASHISNSINTGFIGCTPLIGDDVTFFYFNFCFFKAMADQQHSRQTIEARAQALCEPLIAAEGLELLDLEYVREQGGWVLRLFIDQPGGAVGVEECARASQAVDRALDVEDLIPTGYALEVSSPGLDRPLKKPLHFQQVKGKKVKLKTFAPLFEPPRKNFLGLLTEVSAEGVVVEVEGAGPFRLAFKDIAKANLVFEE